MKCLFSVILLVVSFKTYAQSFEPGLWKTKESVQLNGLQLPESKNEECINSAQAKDAKASIEKELKKQGCALNKWSVKNQKLDANVSCKNDNFEATGKLQGVFSKKSYDLSGDVEGKFKQALPATALIKLSGQWVKACPK